MPQVASTSVGSIRQKGEKFELLSPDGEVMFTGASPGEAQEFAQSLQMPVREGTTGPQQPSGAPQLPGSGLSVFGPPSGPSGITQPNVGAPAAPPATGGPQPPPGVSPLTAARAQLPGPSEFTNLLKKVVDVKLGRRPFTIGIPDEDLRLLTPSAVRGELGRRANDLLRQGADVSAIMDSYRGMYQDTLTVADKYLADMQSRQKMLSEMAFSEPMLTRGVLPESLKSVLSPEEQAIWGEMSTFYKEQFAAGKAPQPYAQYMDEQTGDLTVLFRDPVSGEITQKKIGGVVSPAAPISRVVSPTAPMGAEDAADRAAIQGVIQSITGGDGFVDTAKYQQLRRDVATSTPKLLSWFDSTFGPEWMLNPSDPTARRLLQTTTGGRAIVGKEEERPITFDAGMITSLIPSDRLSKLANESFGGFFKSNKTERDEYVEWLVDERIPALQASGMSDKEIRDALTKL